MSFPKYPKIETLFDRDMETHKVIEGRLRRPEFGLINQWHVTEKIDGTNVRVYWRPAGPELRFGGRTDNAQMPTFLLEHLQDTFTVKKMGAAFESLGEASVVLFGEGYGGKIQKGGNYRPNASFRLFDVLVLPPDGRGGIWLFQEAVLEVALKLGINIAPTIEEVSSTADIVELVRKGMPSIVAVMEASNLDFRAEGIVARSPHGILDRMGRRIMWKLKTKDF
jgi:hypothetical protein